MYFPEKADRVCQPTEYAEARVDYSYTGTGSLWWLRTIGHSYNSAQAVLEDGFITGAHIAGEYANFVYAFVPGTITSALLKQAESSQRPMYVRPATIIRYEMQSAADHEAEEKAKLYSENEAFKQAKIGDTITFGEYRQSLGYDSSDKYTFLYEDLRWKVIDKTDNKLLLLSEAGIDAKPFERDWSDNEAVWEDSSLRTWLNTTFYYSAFSRPERKMLLRTYTREENSYFIDELSNEIYEEAVTDKVFLLSAAEAGKYDVISKAYLFDATDYALSNINEYYGYSRLNQHAIEYYWWLRTTGSTADGYADQPAMVSPKNTIVTESGRLHDPTILVRPVIWVEYDPDMEAPGETEVQSETAGQTESQPQTEHQSQTQSQSQSQTQTQTQSQSQTQTQTQTQTVTPVSYAYLKEAKVDDRIKFGSYEQDNNTANGKEDIEWFVLAKEGSRIFVVSLYALDVKPFHDGDKANWETCSIRTWLNSTFMSTAFDSEQQKYIPVVTVKTGSNNNIVTQDRVFVLSPEEVYEYLSDEPTNYRLFCRASEYAKAQGARVFKWNANDYPDEAKQKEGNCNWWMRQNASANMGRIVDMDGRFYNGKHMNDTQTCVRPAMWIETEP